MCRRVDKRAPAGLRAAGCSGLPPPVGLRAAGSFAFFLAGGLLAARVFFAFGLLAAGSFFAFFLAGGLLTAGCLLAGLFLPAAADGCSSLGDRRIPGRSVIVRRARAKQQAKNDSSRPATSFSRY